MCVSGRVDAESGMKTGTQYFAGQKQHFDRHLGEYDKPRRWHRLVSRPEQLLGIRTDIITVVGPVTDDVRRVIDAAHERGWAVQYIGE